MLILNKLNIFNYLKILIVITLFLLLTPTTCIKAAEEDKYYTISVKNIDDYNKLMKLIPQYNAEIVYSVEELGILQIKTNETIMGKIGSNSIVDTYNPSLRSIESRPNFNKLRATLSQSNLWDMQWDMKKVTNNGESYKIFSGTKNVTVGIIDSGLDIQHPDLKSNIVSGSKNLVPKNGFRGKELEETGEIDRLIDLLGHGTHVAGQIAGNGNIKGVAPEIGIKSYRVFGERTAELLWIIKAIVEAAKDDVDVINISLGNYLINGTAFLDNQQSKTDLAEIKAFKKAITFAKKQGSVIVAAAGNDSLNVNDKEQMYNFLRKKLKSDNISLDGNLLDVPASLPDVVTVSSTGPSNELSLFSNYGKGFIDIASPGGDTRLLKEYGIEIWMEQNLDQKEQIISTGPDQGYFYDAGNSIAAPKVAGTLALIIDKNHLKNRPNQAVKILYKYGVDMDYTNQSLFGHGHLNTYKALQKK
ncbi:peptidase S8 [Bacillus pseudomycoides]|uniref:S8 family peptidase n=1 Tax=Bacillus pseudomycoides TaxID=64104 RepID=UPI000BF82B99|nr:S8 family serine peptidase [Bacillus pseudomycoides]PFZ07904.1 peptidase S8 [Bacillus pseudomycoides]